MTKQLILVLIILGIGVASQAQDIPPMPTVPPAMYDYSTEAGRGIDNLPDDPTRIGGVSLVPDPDAAVLFGYIKWLSSPSGTRELLGDQLSPFADMTMLALVATIVLTGVYLAVRLIVLLIRIMIFIFEIVMMLYHAVIALVDLIWPG